MHKLSIAAAEQSWRMKGREKKKMENHRQEMKIPLVCISVSGLLTSLHFTSGGVDAVAVGDSHGELHFKIDSIYV